MEADQAIKPLERQLMYGDPSTLHPYDWERLGPWRPGIYADREVVMTDIYDHAIKLARFSLHRKPKPPEVEPFVAKATAQMDRTRIS